MTPGGLAGVPDVLGPDDSDVRFDWGLREARVTCTDIAVVVDVLSFSTSVTIAVERGISVFPYAWADARAQEFAVEHEAVLAVGRLEGTRAGAVVAPSLSPAGLLSCAVVPRLVLPSPNGSTIAATLQEGGATVVVGCLRNAHAVGEWLADARSVGRSVTVIAAGERSNGDETGRSALEDILGAGAILSSLAAAAGDSGWSRASRSAAWLFDATRDSLVARLRACVSGRELIERGFGSDVDVAAALDVSSVVPALAGGAFRPDG